MTVNVCKTPDWKLYLGDALILSFGSSGKLQINTKRNIFISHDDANKSGEKKKQQLVVL